MEVSADVSYTVNAVHMANKNMTDYSRFFQNLTVDSIENLQYWDMTNATNIDYMFCGIQLRNNTDMNYITNWNVENVTKMAYTFSNCEYADHNLDLSTWNVKNVKDMINNNKISMSHARVLSKIEEKEKILDLAHKILDRYFYFPAISGRGDGFVGQGSGGI